MLQCTVLVISCLVALSTSDIIQCGQQPTEILNAKAQCDDEVKDGMVEKVRQRARSFFDRVKQEVGMKVENNVEEKKCEYYYCLYKKLGMLKHLALPDLNLIRSWISGKADEANGPSLNSQCFQLLDASDINTQNRCETALHLMVCVNSPDKCEVFKFS